MNKHLATIGIATTALYLGLVTSLLHDRLPLIKTMPLNEVGDFLAGVFGPLAILWLILGFFQQGIELRQNTSALELQAEELKNSVEQQRELVEVSKSQFKAELEALSHERELQRKAQQPQFVPHGIGGTHSAGKTTFTMTIKNVGNTATDVQFTFSQKMQKVAPSKVPSWINGQEYRLEFEYPNWTAPEKSELVISYIDSAGIPGSVSYTLKKNKTGSHPMVEIDKSNS